MIYTFYILKGNINQDEVDINKFIRTEVIKRIFPCSGIKQTRDQIITYIGGLKMLGNKIVMFYIRLGQKDVSIKAERHLKRNNNIPNANLWLSVKQCTEGKS